MSQAFRPFDINVNKFLLSCCKIYAMFEQPSDF